MTFSEEEPRAGLGWERCGRMVEELQESLMGREMWTFQGLGGEGIVV